MKRPQLSNSLWLASTAALFATQPAWADTIPVTGVQLKPTASGIEVILETPSDTSPRVLTSSSGRTLNADIFNTQLRLPKGNTFRASNPTAGITGVKIRPLNSQSIRISVTGKVKVPVGKLVQADQGIILSLKPNSKAVANQAQNRLPKNKQRLINSTTVGQKPQEPVQPNPGNSEVAPSTPSESGRQLLQQLRRQPSSPAQLDIQTQTPPLPNSLNPSPNPLTFPTRPQDVEVVGLEPITLQQAVELARRNNQDLRVAELELERSRAVLREAQADLYPTLSLGAQLSNSRQDNTFTGISGVGTGQTVTPTTVTPGQAVTPTTGTPGQAVTPTTGTPGQAVTPTTGTPGQAVTPTTGTPGQTVRGIQQDSGNDATGLSGNLTLGYNLYTSGRRAANIRAAEEQVRFSQLDVERLTEQLRLDVASDYYNLQGADEQVRINRSAVVNAQANLRDAQAREQAGVGTRFDVLQAQVQLADETQNLTNAVSQQQIARRQLATRINVPQSVSVASADPVEIAGLWNLSLPESIVLAFRNRAELEQQLAQRNISQQRRRAALASLGPQVSLIARYNASNTFEDDRDFADGYSLSANLSLDLYDGGAARARARQQELNAAIAETNFANQRNNVRFEVEQAFTNLQSNLENIQTASVALEQAREALRLARLRFQAGVGTQTDVITQQNALTNAEGRRVNAILDYNRALAQLQRAISSGQPR